MLFCLQVQKEVPVEKVVQKVVEVSLVLMKRAATEGAAAAAAAALQL
jgi:hypothetical protein